MMQENKITPFNTPLETGVRTLTILDAAFPMSLDLQRLVEFDYLSVHSADAGGPKSLHAPLPFRSGELLVRRTLIEKGLNLMMSRGLIRQILSSDGIQYIADDTANPFLNALGSVYMTKLKERVNWVVKRFGHSSEDEIRKMTRRFFEAWSTQFQPIETVIGDKQ